MIKSVSLAAIVLLSAMSVHALPVADRSEIGCVKLLGCDSTECSTTEMLAIDFESGTLYPTMAKITQVRLELHPRPPRKSLRSSGILPTFPR